MRASLATFFFLFLLLNASFSQERLFSVNGFYEDPSALISKATKLKLDRTVLNRLYAQQSDVVQLQLPIDGNAITLNLKKSNLFSKNFRLIESSTFRAVDYVPGYYLQGTVDGERNSFVALSIFENYIGGVVSYRGKNYNLAVANNRNDFFTDDYVIYSDHDYHVTPPQCFTEDDDFPIMIDTSLARANNYPGCPVDIYFETGYDMLQRLGSVDGVMNYLTLLFNHVQFLYHNEDVSVQIREVFVWTSVDPEYNIPTTRDTYYSFSNRMGTSGFNGDLAHFLSFKSGGGGIARLDALCAFSASGRCATSCSLSPNYAAFPNYSFSVLVVTHETGHNLGSRHTHNCNWPGGAIDDCYATEGGCPPGPTPTNGGTIMSYCHLSSTRINFANGFGPLPGDKIRSKVLDASAAACICDCGEMEMDLNTYDIGCSNPTGSAKAIVTGGTGPFTYAWSNGATGDSISGLAAGTYYVTVTGSTPNCKVVRGFKILSVGNTTQVTLSPAATSVTRCLNDSYTLSASVSPGGVYAYQWYNSSGPIAGATSAQYTITSSVPQSASYYVEASSTACLGRSASVSVNFQPVTVPTLSPVGPIGICAGESVNLTASATSLETEWLRNNTPIPGATGSSYTATAAGSYTVRHFSSSNATCSAVSAPVVVSLAPAPDASISPLVLQFCDGDEGTLTHNPDPAETYIWYRNGTPISAQTASSLTVRTSGNYTLKVTDANGCESTSSVAQVTAHPLPAVTLNPANSVLLCDGGSLTISAPALSGGMFTWHNGTTQLSQNTNSLVVTESGNYWVRILNPTTGCENSSSSTQVTITPPPTVFAGNDTMVATGQPIRLRAVSHSAIPVDHYEWIPSTGLNNAFSASPVARLTHDQEYMVKAVYPSGCIATDNVLIKVMKGPALYVPSAFTPNGDGLNDFLRVVGIGLRSFTHLSVYNRYGQRVFYTTSLNSGWDGRWKGEPLPTGSFVYFAEGLDYNGKHISTKGVVTLIR